MRKSANGLATVLLSVGFLAASAQARALPLTNIDGIGKVTEFILWIPSELRGEYSMTHDVDTGRSRYLQQGEWDYSPWFDSEGPPIYEDFEGTFAWTAGIGPDGQVTDPGSMLFIGDLGMGDEILISGQLRMIGVEEQIPSEWDDTTLFYGLQYLFILDLLDARLSGLGNAFRLDLPVVVESAYDTPFHEDFEIELDMFWSDPGLIGLTVAEPGSLALLGLGLAGLGLSRRRKAA